MSYLDNGQVRVGIDLDRGGVITYLADPRRGENIINSHDLGRQVQQSYYSGPAPFGAPHPGWKNWPWNPIGTGDVYGHPARVVQHTNDGRTLYVKSIPMQWALDNVPGECTFETWITLQGDAVHLTYRLNNHRPDPRQYPAMDQELPAVYTIGKLYRLFTYDGPAPFTGAPLRQVQNAGPPWESWTASENWAALLDDTGWGLGVIAPGTYHFIGGFAGTPNQGGPEDNPTGYIAPVRKEILDSNITYTYSCTLVLGTLESIRAYAVRPRETGPDYHFTNDREHWWYINASDSGFPPAGGLRVRLDRDDPQLIGPDQWWPAAAVPRLYIRAAFHTRQNRAELFWSRADAPGFAPGRSVDFTIIPDGRIHTYEVDLAASPEYRGTIAGIRFDPVPSGSAGETMELLSLTTHRPRSSAASLPRSTPPGPGS